MPEWRAALFVQVADQIIAVVENPFTVCEDREQRA
jgi:hypothetical protein